MAELISTLADIEMAGGMLIKLEAIDPTTGAAITGVTVSQVAIYAETDNGPVVIQPDQGTPLWLTIPVDEGG